MNLDITEAVANKFDRTNWNTLKFSDLVENIKEKVVPKESDLEHYIGLEHLDSGSLHIRRFGKTESLKGDKLKIYKGDFIFAKRNSYLKRVAIADFDAVASAHSLVLRAKPENVLPEFLPFFLLSEIFWECAIEISVGSLSPTINWKVLAKQEFLLPPKEQQAEIAELLWAMDEVIERDILTFKALQQFSERFLSDTVSGKRFDVGDWGVYKFGDLGESFGGLSGKSKDDFGEGSSFITYMNVYKNSKINLKEIDYVRIKDDEKQNCVRYGDILLTGSSETPDEVAMSSVVLDNPEGFYLNSFCFGFRLYDFKTLDPNYARFLMRGPEVRRFMHKHAQGSTRFNISKTTIKNKLNLLIPPLNMQYKIIDELEANERNLSLFKNKISSSNSMKKSLINRIF